MKANLCLASGSLHFVANLALQSRGLSGGDILNICLNAIHAGSRDPDPAKWLVTEKLLLRVDYELGTQEAADLLGVSRPHLVKLLEKGALPHRKVGTRRRVLASDVIAFKEHGRQARIRILAELAAEDELLHLNE